MWEPFGARKNAIPLPLVTLPSELMTKEKWVLKSARFPEALSQRWTALLYVARPTLPLELIDSRLEVSSMRGSSRYASPSKLMFAIAWLKLVKLKLVLSVDVWAKGTLAKKISKHRSEINDRCLAC
uniref:Uncharacterized protein MANES_07G043600 n=1 Tax=Rhizophora mucronata TaxID=61149 RepID=A0A2P2MUB1_RHIMU